MNRILSSAVLILALCLAPIAAAQRTSAVMGGHSLPGTIDQIDYKTGLMGLKTKEGALRLHFPPEEIKDLKTGDSIILLQNSHGGGGLGQAAINIDNAVAGEKE